MSARLTISGSILIVDDEDDIRWVLRRMLQDEGYHIIEAKEGTTAVTILEKQPIELALLDLRMPGIDGMSLLKIMRDRFPEVVPVVLTAHGDVSSAVEATKLGAFDFLIKPVSEETILVTIKNGLEKARLTHDVERLEGRLPRLASGPIIGTSPAIKRALELVDKVAPTDLTVLLVGESGTGKELFATMIHRMSKRMESSFIPVDGGSFPETLAESELFGYEKGSFTGANKRRLGKFELAHEGTLFLDEIGNMTLDVQAKILRAIEQKKIYRVGGRQLIPVDVRIISATNANLENMVKRERFREDLFYRLNAFTIEIPALRERKDDIPDLIHHFISLSQWGSETITFLPETMEILLAYDWPGNIRELKNTIERAILIATGPVKPLDLPHKVRNCFSNPQASQVTTPEFRSLKDAGEWGARLEEERLIRHTLQMTGWNRTETAQLLGIDVKTLYNKMKKYNIFQD